MVFSMCAHKWSFRNVGKGFRVNTMCEFHVINRVVNLSPSNQLLCCMGRWGTVYITLPNVVPLLLLSRETSRLQTTCDCTIMKCMKAANGGLTYHLPVALRVRGGR